MKNILVKSFTREFPLVHVQLWGRRYAEKFMGESLPKLPMYVFILKDDMVTAYRNEQKLTEAVNNIISKKIKADPYFIDHLVIEKSRVLTELTEIAKKPEMSKEEFIHYLDNIFDYWEIHYISQFLPLDKERFSETDRERGLELRRTIGTTVTNFWNNITPTLKRLYPELGDLVIYISWDEVRNSIIPTIEELQKRKTEGVIILNDKLVSQESFEKLKSENNFELDEDTVDINVKKVKGQVAFPGEVKGRVRIIMKEEEMSTFQEGEVLVSYVTIPAFVPIMKKAIAFVTDEGGITCHAAIIARELKKPCVIGTKIATKVFKSGDLVEVDATKGEVTLI